MARIEGLDKLLNNLRDRTARARKDERASVLVGYTAAYAIFVHENLQARHRVGQAKFLEMPARTMGEQLRGVIGTALARGRTMAQALVLAGLALQRASQKLVPVDTGNLRASAFTRLE